MTKDISIRMTVRSGRIIKALEDQSWTQTELARKTGISMTAINRLVTMKQSPVGANGDWLESAKDIASALGKMPSELWPEHMLEVRLATSTAELSLDMHEVQEITGETDQTIRREMLAKAFEGINPRHLKVVIMSHQGCTLEEIGAEIGVTRERVRQILHKGYRLARKNLRNRERVETFDQAYLASEAT